MAGGVCYVVLSVRYNLVSPCVLLFTFCCFGANKDSMLRLTGAHCYSHHGQCVKRSM
uniref:Uncharacterized protein n=1 Tax=Anguilla anguilla TaxID=7936 RepID=A0A0E9UB22_ANGAN